MRLKRGVERESCDFCHGRKIKCDRPLRAASGIHTCSACARRDIACRVDDSGDIRLQKRRLNSQKDVSSIDGQHVPSSAWLSPPRVADSSPAVAPESTAIPDTAEEAQTALFDLNAESAFFLDQIFVGNLCSELLYDNYTGLAMDIPIVPTATPRLDVAPGIDHYQDLWRDGALSFDVFMLAVRGYFGFAALALPITFEDAFWSDVQASTASAAFVCAVACRGMPFTEHDEKWLLQKQLAIKFKNLFLQKQQDDPNNTPLDDIEALALMVDFPFDEDDVSGLERLFLSKKSLVLMTLQLGHSTEAGTLSRASERHSLLFWHVYGLDAFACLDSKTASRIPEAETLPHLRNTGSGYLDAVLSLALVARAILQKLCESARHGVRYADVESLYKQLEHWRDSSCPPHLRRWRGDEGEAPSQHLNVQRGVLHLLRINCYMQIENWTDEHGVAVKTMADMMTGPRVEYESLCAVSEGAEMAAWMNSCLVGGYALVDLAPNILRDINAGLGVWTCLHGMQSRAKPTYRVHGHDTGAVAGASLEVAALFRSAVAKAVSHCDTAIVLGRIDAKMAFLRESGNS
ncbi:hypothetical protein V2A60_003733 [Cordyceps javanica]|uniref:Fungal transcriptional regulatory protein n=1 Tax=Cordyceps javanica TaxID=43265 RepID=A0A545UTZ8_9HYPO|nr:Fungal transcriptional regulatory protein [Cordyceps javanica]TQW04844.1 Fungal transcriptional regulatory protein [Cordyceps javanica]